ncbi:hypothetical protein [Desulfolucanica intricata]|nr:hypothetical protein [Desulfolucanica intricata]
MKKENGMYREPYAPQKNNLSPRKRKATIKTPDYVPGYVYDPRDEK